MKKSRLLVLVVLCFYKLAFAQDATNSGLQLKFRGLAFGDAYYVQSSHIPEANDIGGFVLRRGYLTFDTKFGKHWFARFRHEINQSGAYQEYEYELDFKDVFIGYKLKKHTFIFGLAPSKTFDLVEEYWGARYLARTPMDLQGVASRDFGTSADGVISSKLNLKYRVMIGAGIDFGNENGDGRKYMGAISWYPKPHIVIDFYADHEKLPGETDRNTFQLFIGSKKEHLRWGLLYSNQFRQQDPRLELFSAFVYRKLGEKIGGYLRMDRIMEPSPRGNNISYIPFDPASRATMFISAAEWPITKHLTITPNLITIFYDENDEGISPKTDVNFRLTTFVQF